MTRLGMSTLPQPGRASITCAAMRSLSGESQMVS